MNKQIDYKKVQKIDEAIYKIWKRIYKIDEELRALLPYRRMPREIDRAVEKRRRDLLLDERKKLLENYEKALGELWKLYDRKEPNEHRQID